jgi:hypothetical protein
VSPFLIFGILYGDVEIRILRVAHYIETELRPTLIDSSPEAASCLGWESYIRKKNELTTLLSRSNLATFMSRANRMRYVVFVLPASASLVLLWLNRSGVVHKWWCCIYLGVDFFLLLLFVEVFTALKHYEKAIREKTV